MKLFIKSLSIFIIPVFFFLALLAYIDPFSYFSTTSRGRKEELKGRISKEVNARLYKIIRYTEEPCKIVVLGDSRADQLSTDYFEELLNEPVSNLSYGGGTLPEIISTLEYIQTVGNLKRVYVGISFNLYNSKNAMNMVPEAIKIQESLLAYLSSKYCFKASLLFSKALLFNDNLSVGKPPFTEEEFWNYQLYSAATNFYRAYGYPDEYFKALEKLSDHCAKKGIDLTFFIPPTHVDLQKRIADFKLEKEEERFKLDLSTMGEVYDFDYANDLTVERKNFKDPYHSSDSISRLVVRELVTGHKKYAKSISAP